MRRIIRLNHKKNQKGEGLVSALIRFIKNALKKLFDESKKSVVDAYDSPKKAKQQDVASPDVANVHQRWRSKMKTQKDNSRGKY